MKKLIFAFVLLFSVPVFGQLSAGAVSYKIEVSSDDPNSAMALMLFEDATMTTTFMPKFNKVETRMGEYMESVTIVDLKKKKVLSLINTMGDKTAIRYTLAEMLEEINNTTQVVKSEETKTILGYTCHKATSTNDDGGTAEYWYTNDISAITNGQQFYSAKLGGFILEETVETMGLTMTFTATAISDKAPVKSDFSMKVPEGYEVMTKEEFEKANK